VYEKFTDIRLVGTPPQSIGKFGGDTDNWMWPRHTGDFSMFRIYANKENKPAAYAEDNVPYKPKHSLPVSLDGVREGDFAMIMGFPGRTNRYETSMGIQLAIDKVNPSIVKLREKRLELMKEQMEKDVAVRIKMSSRYAQVANYWKYFIGQTEQLKRLKVVDQKKKEEAEFKAWAKGKAEYDNIFGNLEKVYETYRPISTHRTYLNEGIFGSITFAMANSFRAYVDAVGEENENAKAAAIAGIKARANYYFGFYHPVTEEKTMAAMLTYFYNDIPKDQHPDILQEIINLYPSTEADGNKAAEHAFTKFADSIMRTSMMHSKEEIEQFLENPDLEKLSSDPALELISSFMRNYEDNYKEMVNTFNEAKADAGTLLVKGMMEMKPNANYYPDANSTFRLTYGTVKSYDPTDGAHYNFYTTLNGVEEKFVDGDDEFDAPDELLELNKKKDFGVYADAKTKELHTCFITNNDITGGNSGSPVMNGKGELIGLAFDGNWEAMSGDIYFDTRYKRTINVDVRYVLFLIDKLAGAQNIIKELNLVKNGKKITLYK
jgi:predicted house-cleaning noncanonical NTP pyrophosphatase (MazG superfamily)